MIFDQLSYRKFFESKFSLLNYSNFWTVLTRKSRSARSRSANSLWTRACSRLDCAYPVRVCPISTAWESISLQFTNIIFFGKIRSVFMTQDLGFCFCEQLFLFSFQNDPEVTVVKLLVQFALSWHPDYGSPRTYWKLTVHVETNFLFVSDEPATGSHLLLAPEGTVVKPANSWCARRQSQHLGTSRRCHQGWRLSWHSSPGRMKLLRGSLQSIFFLKVPRPLPRDFFGGGISSLVSFSISRLMLEPIEPSSCTGLSVLTWPTDKDWLDNKLSSKEWQGCLRPAGSSRSWMNSGEDSALPMVSSLISESCRYDGIDCVAGLLLEEVSE